MPANHDDPRGPGVGSVGTILPPGHSSSAQQEERPLKTTLAALATTLVLLVGCGDTDADTGDTAADAVESPLTELAEPVSPGATEPADVTEPAEETAPAEETGPPAATDAEAAGFPVTIESEGGTWTLEEPPERIVSLSPSATETLFAIAAGDQVVATDAFSTFPPEAPTTDLSGFDPNVEAITAFEPDLVVIADDANDLVAGLGAADVPVLVSPAPATIEAGYDTVIELGRVTGHPEAADELVERLRTEIDDALALAPDESVRVYHELGSSLFAASSFGFVGDVYARLGAENIADDGDPDRGGFPQLTQEYVIAADPEVIVITDQVDYGAEDVVDRPGWGTVTAVVEGDVVVVDADIASRWGPRLPQFVAAAAEALASAAGN